MKQLLAILFACYVCNMQAQPIGKTVAAQYPALGAYSKNEVDIYGTRSNSAALAQLIKPAVAVYAEKRFMQAELGLYAASAGLKTKVGAFAFHGTYFGSSLFHQMQLSLAYGLKVTDKIDVGVQFNYYGLSQANGYGIAKSTNATVGAMFHLTDQVHVGVQLYNPTGSKWSKTEGEKIPAVYTFGLGYEVSKKLFISGEVVKEEKLAAQAVVGLQYRFAPQLMVRAGASPATSSFFVGVGLELAAFRIDFSASYHQQLGVGPGMLILFRKEQQTEPVQ